MATAEYDTAHKAAYDALSDVSRPVLRNIIAESVAAFVVGKGGWGVQRWNSLATDTSQKRSLVMALMRDLPESATVSTGPVDAAVTAAATALIDALED
jgi:hypothetical protein